MPHVIGGFIGSLFLGGLSVLTAVGFSIGTAAAILNVGIQLAGLALLGALARKLITIPDLSETARSNLVTVRGTLEHQRIIYGEVLVSGPLWYMNTAGTNNQSLYHAIVVAGHKIEDITDVWFDDEIIPDASIDWAGDGSVDSGWLAGDTSLQTTTYLDKFLGADDQAASADLIAAFTEITSQHQGRGIAYFIARTDYFEGQTDVFSRGAPNNYKALVKGKLVYNPNSDGTQSWGTGPHRVDDDSTWEYSNNPALCWADYMIDGDLGFGEDASRIDYAYVASVAAINSVQVATPTSETTQIFACNGTLSTGTTHQGNLESILSSANMTMALIQGVWKLRGWEYETPTLAFTDGDLRKDMQISLSTEETKRYNTVRAQFIDTARKWQAHQAPVFTSSEYVARDNSETLINDIQLPMTTDMFMAQRLAAGVLEQSDLQRTVIYPSNFKTLPVEIGGTIMLSNTKLGWDEDTFRVTNYKINDMAGIDLVLQEDNSAAYTNVATNEYTVSSGGVYLTADPSVPAPSSFYITPIVGGLSLNWTNPPARLYEFTQIHRNFVNSFDNAVLEKRTRNNNWLDTPNEQGEFFYWIRSENFAGELSDRVPSGGGLSRRWLEDSNMLADPTFEKTPLGTGTPGNNSFWTDIDSFDFSPTDFKGYASVESDGTVIKTAYLHHVFVINSEQQGFNQGPIHNTKFTPVIEAAKYHLNVVYRVPIYTAITSGQLAIEFQGRFAHQLGDNWGYQQLRVEALPTITNSLGWTTFSKELVYSDFTFSNSATHIGLGFYFSGTADVTTGTLHIDVDRVLLKETI